MRKLITSAVAFLTFFSVASFAQDAASSKSVLTGHVFCGDTGLPARFATVRLQAETSADGLSQIADEIRPALTKDKPDLATLLAKLLKGDGLSAVTQMDGSFRIENVPPGVYYAIPQLAGYLSPFSKFSGEELMGADAETRKQIQSMSQRIVVEARHPANIDLRLERGAAISGQVLFDDGSPASNVVTQLMRKQKDGGWKKISTNTSGTGANRISTDDLGHYRIAGLPVGEYGIMAELPIALASSGMGISSISIQFRPGDALQIFSGNVFRQREMKGFALGAGEELSVADLTFPVNGLFTVSGTVVVKRDAHPVNTGMVKLLDPVDKSILRSGMVVSDGSFTFANVPAGEYLVQVSNAADIDPTSKPEKLVGFEAFAAAIPGTGDALRKHSHDVWHGRSSAQRSW